MGRRRKREGRREGARDVKSGVNFRIFFFLQLKSLFLLTCSIVVSKSTAVTVFSAS